MKGQATIAGNNVIEFINRAIYTDALSEMLKIEAKQRTFALEPKPSNHRDGKAIVFSNGFCLRQRN